MKLIPKGITGIALGSALAMLVAQSAGAQAGVQSQSSTTRDQTTTTTTENHSSYDSGDWQAPRGYIVAYPENGKANMVARQGYSAGFNQGQADASRGKKFEPTDNDAYGKAVIPKGMNHDEFKQNFREAFVKGYSNGYKGGPDETH